MTLIRRAGTVLWLAALVAAGTAYADPGIGDCWNALVTAASTPGDYCNVQIWRSSSVNVDCYGPGGAAVDTDFPVFAVSSSNHKSIAFADCCASESYQAGVHPSSSYNPSGTNRRHRPKYGSLPGGVQLS
jgi:hypothetical protein